jgi:sulfoxide reductase heme-binding subunit YedZ
VSAGYQAVTWNRQKRRYDAVLAAGVLLYLGVFAGVTALLHPAATIESILIRATGTGALLLLHVALAIGPLARLDRRFLPLLYNRRHLGVTTFLLGLTHGVLVVVQYHALGNENPLVSLLSANARWTSLPDLPFELFGAVALAILFLMAATSHDAWLAQLTAPVWKRLHMMVYPAYALLVCHVAFGALQDETSLWLVAVLGAGMGIVLGLHLVAGWRERGLDREQATGGDAGARWVDVGAVDTIPEKRARVVTVSGERVAIFRYDGKVSAVSNVCRHQNGPLGEGRILDGCITCPWHGYQYLPATGASPPPFTERVPTFRVQVRHGRVELDPRPLPPGTRVEPAACDGRGGTPPEAAGSLAAEERDFYVGYQPTAPLALAGFLRRTVTLLLVMVAGLAAVVASAQQGFAPAQFAFGRTESFAGVLLERPLPLLVLGEGATAEALLLTAPGKRGARELVVGRHGQRVTLRGTVAERDGQRLLEVVPETIEGVGTVDLSLPRSLGRITLAGEVVDGKCFLGVMSPGEGKAHRGCAVRCLAGGVPALLVVRLADGGRGFVPLAATEGSLVPAILDRVAEPVVVEGTLLATPGRLPVLATTAEEIRRRSP